MKQRLTAIAAVLGFFVAVIAVLDFMRRRLARMDDAEDPAFSLVDSTLTAVNGDRA